MKVKIVHSAVGGITESDVLLAKTAKGLVIGFNVRPDGGASQAARSQAIEIRSYSIVYELIDDMKKAMADYKAEGKANWISFKEEFNHDMEEFGAAFKDLTVKNVK